MNEGIRFEADDLGAGAIQLIGPSVFTMKATTYMKFLPSARRMFLALSLFALASGIQVKADFSLSFY